jgi:siroheme synthase-like protein
MLYPLFLDLQDAPVLVAGAGKVALRKIGGLIETGASITVVAPEAREEMATLPVHWHCRRFRASDLRGMRLAFAATDDRAVNRRIGALARDLGIPVNVADSREECTFHVPARVQHGDLQVAVSTGGRSPRLAVQLRNEIRDVLRRA